MTNKLRIQLSQPQLLHPEAHDALLRETAREKMGSELERPGMTIENGIATIPVYGLLARNLDPLDMYFGATDYNEIVEETKAAQTEGAEVIVYSFDTFGGIATGIQETGEAIANANIPTVAFVNDYAFSAGYWLASQCDLIVSMRTAEVGSIGVRQGPYLTYARALENAGVDVFFPKDGEHKAPGGGGYEELTDEQKDLILSKVKETGAAFRAAVSARRPRISEEDMQGQTFTGEVGLSRGFTDVTISDKDELNGTIERLLSNNFA